MEVWELRCIAISKQSNRFVRHSPGKGNPEEQFSSMRSHPKVISRLDLPRRLYFIRRLPAVARQAGMTLQRYQTCHFIVTALYVEKDTAYTLSGTFRAVVVNQPAFGTL
ncbi:hypothetical protein HGA88_02650 [Candidatus Roizmanbacteria bacterium]|nr:hypothetical protein [Candidatus Roizmanbacteria bacterium]